MKQRVTELINRIGNSLDAPNYAEKVLTECGKEILEIVDKFEETKKENLKEFCEKLRGEVLSHKMDLVANVKCPDGEYRSRPMLDVATVLEIIGDVLKREVTK